METNIANTVQAATLTVYNPYNGELVGSVPRRGMAEIAATVERAKTAARVMRAMPLHRRAEILSGAARQLQNNGELAQIIVRETGKTIREARAEVVRAAGILQLAAEEVKRLHGETIPFDALANGEGRTGYSVREPVGIVGAITPWNVPLALSAHKIGPAIAGGNAVIHKPAEQTPFDALEMQQAFLESGLPPDALQVVTGTGEEAGDALVTHPDVAFVSFTGSREVGTRLPSRAGYKRVALELGGNSPVVIAPSADLPDAAAAIVRGGFAVAGQLCISVQRIVVHASVRARLIEELVPRIHALRVGDPMNEATDVGTLIGSDACDRVEREIGAAQQTGATILVGGKRLGPAAYAPTLLDNVRPDTLLAQNEAFAPVVLLIAYDTIKQAVAIANATPYGLNAGIFTNDLREALFAAREIEAGSVMVNDVPTFRSDLMPYGGRKQSGLGREGVRYALEEMTDLKVVCFR